MAAEFYDLKLLFLVHFETMKDEKLNERLLLEADARVKLAELVQEWRHSAEALKNATSGSDLCSRAIFERCAYWVEHNADRLIAQVLSHGAS